MGRNSLLFSCLIRPGNGCRWMDGRSQFDWRGTTFPATAGATGCATGAGDRELIAQFRCHAGHPNKPRGCMEAEGRGWSSAPGGTCTLAALKSCLAPVLRLKWRAMLGWGASRGSPSFTANSTCRTLADSVAPNWHCLHFQSRLAVSHEVDVTMSMLR